ncbi:hypothetical protein BY996DRAFT_4572977 [Phakopsora pachyrhizi]|nr:hypothetical protein BY996DRAFT_4572977 [Phakopsora pachyrhizi]
MTINSNIIFSPSSCSILSLRFLPKFKLIVKIPQTYPIKSSPLLKIDCTWATDFDLNRAKKSLDAISSIEGQIWNCVDWLEHEWFDPLRIEKSSVKNPIKISIDLRDGFSFGESKDHFIENDKKLVKLAFMDEEFDCGICLETQQGRKCIKLERCGHVFCRECISDYFTLMIQEGTIEQVRCCDSDCPLFITESELDDLVGITLKNRFNTLYEKKLVEKDPNNCYCPIESCKSFVIYDGPKISEEDDAKVLVSNLRTCQKCGFSFCFGCKRTWHGSMNRCSLPLSERIIDEFFVGDVFNEKKLMRNKYKFGWSGRDNENFKKIFEKLFEELINQSWKAANSTECVSCFISIEKISGCNHMVCPKCKTHFCYRCSKKIKNLGKHYGDPDNLESKECFGQLFENVKLGQSLLNSKLSRNIERLNIIRDKFQEFHR